MASAAVDWTVDKLLAGVRTLNARAESAQNTIRANRARYLDTLRGLPQIVDAGAREALRAQLRDWIRQQVAVENRFNAFASKLARAKDMAKRFLSSAGVTPPAYLGAVQLAVPVVVWGLVAAGLVSVGVIMALNATQSRGMDGLQEIARLAREQGWTAAQTGDALKAYRAAARGTTPDPTGFGRVLEAALPILILGAAVFFLGPMLQRRRAST